MTGDVQGPTGEPGSAPADPLLDPDLCRRPVHLAVRVVALARIAEAREALALWDAGGGAEELHHLRVALRRLRSWSRGYRPWLKGSLRRRDRRALGRLARATGRCRDLDVQVATLASAEGLPPEGEATAAHLARRLRRSRKRAGDRARSQLLGDLPPLLDRVERSLLRYRGRMDPRDPWAAPPSLGAASVPLVLRSGARLALSLEGIRTPADRGAAHRARIEGKRLRYLLEPLQAGCPAVTPVIGRLRELQDRLGTLQDTHLLLRELARSVDRGGGRRGSPGPEGVRVLDERLRATLAETYRVFQQEWMEERGADFLDTVAELARELERCHQAPEAAAPARPTDPA